jgi:PilM
MWHILLLAIFVSITGYYSLSDQQQVNTAQGYQADHLAENMGTYRASIVDYCMQNPGLRNISISKTALRAGIVPSWLPDTALEQWGNYIDVNGMIYIYPASPLPRNITSAVVALSKNSILVGEMKTAPDGIPTLYSPLHGKPPMPIKMATAPPAILEGSLVWLASAN